MIERLPNQTSDKNKVPVLWMPIKFSDADEPTIERAPFLSEHTEEILAEIARYSDDKIDELRKKDIV